MKRIYRVSVTIERGVDRPLKSSFIFGSRYEADTFIEEAHVRFGCAKEGFSIDHVMSRKEALDEIRAALDETA